MSQRCPVLTSRGLTVVLNPQSYVITHILVVIAYNTFQLNYIDIMRVGGNCFGEGFFFVLFCFVCFLLLSTIVNTCWLCNLFSENRQLIRLLFLNEQQVISVAGSSGEFYI